MQKNVDLYEETSFFSAKRLGEVVILRVKNNFLLRTSDLDARDTVLDYLSLISRSDAIKVVVIIGSPEKTGRDEYIEFYDAALKSKLGLTAIHRMCNVVNQFILGIVDLNKIVVHANSGRVISLFLNVSLACDYRIVADNTVFQNPYLELGIVPKGGGAFLLPKILGVSKAYEILLSGIDITANEALNLGIVNMVVPLEELEKAAVEVAQTFAGKPAHSLSGVKRLLNYSLKGLSEYLELENEELLSIVNSPDFSKNAVR